MIISYDKLLLIDENHSQLQFDKEGVTYDFCFCWRNSYYICICHEARLKKRYTIKMYIIIL